MSIDDTLAERGERYGDFSQHAAIAQQLQDVMRDSNQEAFGRGWDFLSAVQKQALTAIADKIARILSGDPDFVDNWHDIQGYARLVEIEITREPAGGIKISEAVRASVAAAVLRGTKVMCGPDQVFAQPASDGVMEFRTKAGDLVFSIGCDLPSEPEHHPAQPAASHSKS
jgi:hypothetical protein